MSFSFCPNCGTALLNNARFCQNCGVTLIANPQGRVASPPATVVNANPVAKAAQPATAVASGAMHKNRMKLPPGEYTIDRKWRLQNGQWVTAGKWKWARDQYLRTDTNMKMVRTGGPSGKLLTRGRLLIFRHGSPQWVDAQRHVTWKRPPQWRRAVVGLVVEGCVVYIGVLWWPMLTMWWPMLRELATHLGVH